MAALARFRDWLLLVVCNLVWASYSVTIKVAQRQMGPLFATFFPYVIATVLLIPTVHFLSRDPGGKSRKGLSKLHVVLEFLMVGVIVTAGQVLSAWGTRLTLASNAALLSLALPVSMAIMAYVLLGERMTPMRWVSFVLAIAGVVQCAGIDWKELNFTSTQLLLGNWLVFIGLLGSAFYNVYSKRLLLRYSPLRLLLYTYYSLCLILLPITLYVEPASFLNFRHYTLSVWSALLVLAIFQSFFTMVIFLTVLTRLDATQVGLSTYLMPFFGVVLAAIILRERLTKSMVLGGLLVVASTLLVTVYEERRKASDQRTTANGVGV